MRKSLIDLRTWTRLAASQFRMTVETVSANVTMCTNRVFSAILQHVNFQYYFNNYSNNSFLDPHTYFFTRITKSLTTLNNLFFSNFSLIKKKTSGYSQKRNQFTEIVYINSKYEIIEKKQNMNSYTSRKFKGSLGNLSCINSSSYSYIFVSRHTACRAIISANSVHS